MNKLVNITLAGLFAVGVAGCYKIEKSGPIQKQCVLSEKEYTPSRTETNVSPRIAGSGGLGIGADGGFGPSMGGIVISSKTIPEEYKLFVNCKDFNFTERVDKEKYGMLNEGQKINVTYEEVYKVKKDRREFGGFNILDIGK